MASIEWYFDRTGPGQVGDIAAHSHVAARALKKIANRIGDRAASNLDTRAVRRTGQSHITVTKGHLDWYVNLEDPKGGAMAIEFGTDDTPALSPLRDAVGDAMTKGIIL